MSAFSLQFTDDTEFSYAIGRIKVLETQMIPKIEFDRMIDNSIPQIEKSLSEYGYSENNSNFLLMDREKTFQIVEALVRRVSKYYDFYKIYFLKNDIEKMKTLLKIKLLQGNNVAPDYMPEQEKGILSDGKITDILENKSFRYISKTNDDLKLLSYYFGLIETKKSAKWIDFYLDKLYLALLMKGIKKLKINFLRYYYEHYIDFLNIENLIRFKILEKSLSEYKSIFFEVGSLKWLDLKDLYDEKIDKLPDRLYHKEYYEYLRKGIEGWQENKNFNRLELEKDNYLISILKKARIRAFGIEPVIGYLEGKEVEYKNIRIILEGKKTKIKENKIKELLRDTYV